MKIRFISIILVAPAVLALVPYSSHVLADDRPVHSTGSSVAGNSSDFNPGGQLSKSMCTGATGSAVIDVTQKVQNDADSGEAGNYWAFDYYSREIKVWATKTTNTYCAVVTYDGRFYAVPGQVGPGNRPAAALINTNTSQPVNGDYSGGRRATIVGTLLPTPTWPRRGSIGTTNYQCNIAGTCPAFISWSGQYFSAGYTYNDDWWGWKYLGGSHGTWLNVISGNSGNIL